VTFHEAPEPRSGGVFDWYLRFVPVIQVTARRNSMPSTKTSCLALWSIAAKKKLVCPPSVRPDNGVQR
jgi:hypothetical protein